MKAVFLWGLVFLAACAGPAVKKPPPLQGRPSSEVVFRCPLARARVLSPFGKRGRRFHEGIDLLQTRGGGDPVFVAAEGRVAEAGWVHGYGRMVLVEHANGWYTRYAHLRSFPVKKGQWLKAGARVGIVGATGHATTAHLHFELLLPDRRPVNPAPYIFKR